MPAGHTPASFIATLNPEPSLSAEWRAGPESGYIPLSKTTLPGHELMPIRIGTLGKNAAGRVRRTGRQRVQLISGSPVQIEGLLVAQLLFHPIGPIALRSRWMAAVKAEATSPEKDQKIPVISLPPIGDPLSGIRSLHPAHENGI